MVGTDTDFAMQLRNRLEQAGYQVVGAHGVAKALAVVAKQAPQAVILEQSLDHPWGLALLEHIRQTSSVPVLVLAECADYLAQAFSQGADDYLRKPFSTEELLIRLRARLLQRRTSHPRWSGLHVDWDRAEVSLDGNPVLLTAREFQLLQALYQNRHQVVTRAWLLEQVWRFEAVGEDRLVDSAVKRLRRKIGVDLVETVRGIGFRLARQSGMLKSDSTKPESILNDPPA